MCAGLAVAAASVWPSCSTQRSTACADERLPCAAPAAVDALEAHRSRQRERDCYGCARHIILRVRAARAVDDGGHAHAVVQDDVAAHHVDDEDEEDEV